MAIGIIEGSGSEGWKKYNSLVKAGVITKASRRRGKTPKQGYSGSLL